MTRCGTWWIAAVLGLTLGAASVAWGQGGLAGGAAGRAPGWQLLPDSQYRRVVGAARAPEIGYLEDWGELIGRLMAPSPLGALFADSAQGGGLPGAGGSAPGSGSLPEEQWRRLLGRPVVAGRLVLPGVPQLVGGLGAPGAASLPDTAGLVGEPMTVGGRVLPSVVVLMGKLLRAGTQGLPESGAIVGKPVVGGGLSAEDIERLRAEAQSDNPLLEFVRGAAGPGSGGEEVAR